MTRRPTTRNQQSPAVRSSTGRYAAAGRKGPAPTQSTDLPVLMILGICAFVLSLFFAVGFTLSSRAPAQTPRAGLGERIPLKKISCAYCNDRRVDAWDKPCIHCAGGE